MTKLFDFIVIGAMKCGTTTLHNLLVKDSRIALPVNKEAPFFTSEIELAEGIDAFLSKFYGNFSGKILGKITPDYLMWPIRSAQSISQLSPDTKIIAVLRNPIDRLVSHYSMCVGLGLEHRGIEEAIKTCLEAGYVGEDVLTATNSYIACSEYGHALCQYYSALPPQNILVLDFKQLLSNPEETLGEFYTHIGIQYSPTSNEVKMYHSLNRGGKLRVVKKFMFGVGKYSRKLIIPFLPNKIRLALRFKLVELKVEAYSPNYKANDLSPTLLARLDKHFRNDQMKAVKCGINLGFLNKAPEN